MGYASIENLYKNQDILMFKECYAMEKIHGTSAHILFKIDEIPSTSEKIYTINYFSGGEKHENFVKLFNEKNLLKKFKEMNISQLTIFGEAYGGKCQGMSATYGKELKFVAFDVKIGNNWLTIPDAEEIVKSLDLEFVYYTKCSTDLIELNKQRDADSVQAFRNGMGWGKKREGIVLRPLIEVKKNNSERICAKHKREDFSETKTSRKVTPLQEWQIKNNADAKEIAEEWVTINRLNNILSHLKEEAKTIKNMGNIIRLMISDVLKEGNGEVENTDFIRKALGKKTAQLCKEHLKY